MSQSVWSVINQNLLDRILVPHHRDRQVESTDMPWSVIAYNPLYPGKIAYLKKVKGPHGYWTLAPEERGLWPSRHKAMAALRRDRSQVDRLVNDLRDHGIAPSLAEMPLYKAINEPGA